MNKAFSFIFDNVSNIIHRDQIRNAKYQKESFQFTAKKKIFTIKTKFQEKNNHVMIDSYGMV